MKTFICTVSNSFPDNYEIGLNKRLWGVVEQYQHRIRKVRKGDQLVFFVGGVFKSLHRIESEVFKDPTPLWPPYKGSYFPYRIRISNPIKTSDKPVKTIAPQISFMKDKKAWGGTIQGAAGVFNDRLTEDDVRIIFGSNSDASGWSDVELEDAVVAYVESEPNAIQHSHIINIPKIKYYIEKYKSRFEEIHLQEIYKWKAFKHFQDHWDVNSLNFTAMLKESLSKTENLLVSGNYWPQAMLIENSELSEEQVRKLFLNLIDEEEDLRKRISEFKVGMEDLNAVNFPEKRLVYQDHRAILVYLSLVSPERYYLYKYNMFQEFAKIIDFSYTPKKGKIENIGQYLSMCDSIRNELVKDQELLKLHKGRITEDCFYDINYNLLTQDFIYAVTSHLSKSSVDFDDNNFHVEFTLPIPLQISEQNIKSGRAESSFKPKLIDWKRKHNQNTKDGKLGEDYAVRYEVEKLKKLGISNEVIHTSVVEGDGAGYDIQSVDEKGNIMYIEVKTTKGKCSAPFTITRTELKRSIKEKGHYYLYRLFNYDHNSNSFKIGIFNGDLTNFCKNPETFKVEVEM